MTQDRILLSVFGQKYHTIINLVVGKGYGFSFLLPERLGWEHAHIVLFANGIMVEFILYFHYYIYYNFFFLFITAYLIPTHITDFTFVPGDSHSAKKKKKYFIKKEMGVLEMKPAIVYQVKILLVICIAYLVRFICLMAYQPSWVI